MILRPAQPSDIDELAEVSRAAFVATFGHLYRPDDLAAFLAEYRTAERYRSVLHDPGTSIQLAEVDGLIAAFCVIVRGHRFAQQPDPPPRKPVLISQLYCAPGMAGRGLGAQLVEWAIGASRAWGADVVQLSVYSENFGAQRFYRRFGFARIADIDFWVGNHRDPEFLYQLTLPAG